MTREANKAVRHAAALLCSIAMVVLAACSQEPVPTQYLKASVGGPPPPAPPPPPAMAPASLLTREAGKGNQGTKLAYTHDPAVEMADDKIGPRFERARTGCLEDLSMKCNLISASITAGDSNAGVRANAQLSVRLPHE